jgi:hypothetical protein
MRFIKLTLGNKKKSALGFLGRLGIFFEVCPFPDSSENSTAGSMIRSGKTSPPQRFGSCHDDI